MELRFLSGDEPSLCVHEASRRWGKSPALEIDGETISFRSLSEEVELVERELRPSNRLVAVRAEPSKSAILRVYACLVLKRPIVLLHAKWPRAEIERVLSFAQPDLVIAGTEVASRAVSADAPPLLSTDQALVTTSGSSGMPKIVCLSHHALKTAAAVSNERVPLQSGDRWLLSLPFAHIGGLSIITRCLVAGATCVLAHPRADLSRALAQHPVTHVSLVPTQLKRLLSPPVLLPELKSVLVGGAPLSSALEGQAVSAGLPIQPTYGLTEMGSQVATRPLGDEGLALSLLSGVEARLARPGTLQLRGPTLMRGYLGEPPLGNETWFSTSDKAVFTDSRKLNILGRADNVIISGGENISPETVERELENDDAVSEVVVVGVPDSEWGQRLVALVIRQKPFAQQTPISSWTVLRRSLPSYAIPKEIFVVSELPRLPSGKLNRAASLQVAIRLSNEASRGSPRSSKNHNDS